MIISVAQAQLFLFAFTRIMAILIHVPNLGGSAIPSQVRIAFGIVLTTLVVPWQALAGGAEEVGLFGMLIGIGTQIIIGSIIGYAAQVVFGIIQLAADTMGMSSGFQAGRVFNPALEQSGSAFDQFFILLTMLLFLLIDGHHIVLAAVKRSFEVLPITGTLPAIHIEAILVFTSQMILTGVQIALPVLGALILTDLALGLLARVAPQVQVFFLGLPLKVGIALLGLSISMAVIMPHIASLFQKLGGWMIALLLG